MRVFQNPGRRIRSNIIDTNCKIGAPGYRKEIPTGSFILKYLEEALFEE